MRRNPLTRCRVWGQHQPVRRDSCPQSHCQPAPEQGHGDRNGALGHPTTSLSSLRAQPSRTQPSWGWHKAGAALSCCSCARRSQRWGHCVARAGDRDCHQPPAATTPQCQRGQQRHRMVSGLSTWSLGGLGAVSPSGVWVLSSPAPPHMQVPEADGAVGLLFTGQLRQHRSLTCTRKQPQSPADRVSWGPRVCWVAECASLSLGTD